jgi:mannose-6-phosphate isomerase
MDSPLRVDPVLKSYIWGGTTLARRRGASGEEPVAESWEVADHGTDVTAVASGPYAGRTLRELYTREREALAGEAPDPADPDRFPLLLKLLDSQKKLSVQVHPDDAYALENENDLGKTEAWYILGADEGACLWVGLEPGVTPEVFARHIEAGTVEECLHRVEVEAGQVYSIPAGTVHALGAGLRVVEIQQNSNTTYRLFDWNRVGFDGKPRPLHVEKGLAVIDFDRVAPGPQTPERIEQPGCTRERFVQSEKFVFEKLSAFTGPVRLQTASVSFHILAAVTGPVTVRTSGGEEVLEDWQTCLVPAAAGAYTLHGPSGAAALLFHVPPRS